MNCPRCGYPLTPSPNGDQWCAVWGTHPQIIATPRRITRNSLLLAADAELHGNRHLRAVS